MIIVPDLNMQKFKIENGEEMECEDISRKANIVYEGRWLKYKFIEPEGLPEEDIVRFAYVCDDPLLLERDVINYLVRKTETLLSSSYKHEGETFYRFLVKEPEPVTEYPKEGLYKIHEQLEQLEQHEQHEQNEHDTRGDEETLESNRIELTTEPADQEDMNTMTDIIPDIQEEHNGTTKIEEENILILERREKSEYKSQIYEYYKKEEIIGEKKEEYIKIEEEEEIIDNEE